MKIGLFFGSFNPIHVGHLIVADYMLNELDKVWLVVSPQNPFKQQADLLDAQLRLEMVQLAVKDYDKIEASDIELHMPVPSYTIDTLNKLSANYPDDKFTLIMGSDNLEHLHKWKDYKAILQQYSIIVYPRVGYSAESIDLKGNISITEAPQMNISATYIRQQIANKQPYRCLLPKEIHHFIAKNQLYHNKTT